MYLLYLDESGNESDPKDRHFILGGAAIFEQTTFHLSAALDAIKDSYFPTTPPVAFHASHIHAGRGFWRNVQREIKAAILRELGQAIADTFKDNLFLFAAVIEKSNQLWGEDAVKSAAEQVCNRFDRLLQRCMQQQEDAVQLRSMAEGIRQYRLGTGALAALHLCPLAPPRGLTPFQFIFADADDLLHRGLETSKRLWAFDHLTGWGWLGHISTSLWLPALKAKSITVTHHDLGCRAWSNRIAE